MKRNAGAALAAASSDAQLNQRFHDMEISAGAGDGDEYAETTNQKRARHGSHGHHSHHATPALVTAASASPSPASRSEVVEAASVADLDPDPVMTPALSRQAATETFIRRQLELRAIADARESSRCVRCWAAHICWPQTLSQTNSISFTRMTGYSTNCAAPCCKLGESSQTTTRNLWPTPFHQSLWTRDFNFVESAYNPIPSEMAFCHASNAIAFFTPHIAIRPDYAIRVTKVQSNLFVKPTLKQGRERERQCN
jgi:hypothetical protein